MTCIQQFALFVTSLILPIATRHQLSTRFSTKSWVAFGCAVLFKTCVNVWLFRRTEKVLSIWFHAKNNSSSSHSVLVQYKTGRFDIWASIQSEVIRTLHVHRFYMLRKFRVYIITVWPSHLQNNFMIFIKYSDDNSRMRVHASKIQLRIKGVHFQ